MPGPTINPRPNAMPMMPNDLVAVFRLGHIGDVRLRDRQIACSQSINDPRQKDHPQRVSEAKNQKANACADLTHQQDRPAADTVG